MDSLKKQLEDEKRSRLVQEAGFLQAWNWIEAGAKFRSVVFVFTKSWNCLQQESIFPGCSNWSYQKCVRNPVLLILAPNTFRVISFYQLLSASGQNRCSCGDKRRRQQRRPGQSRWVKVESSGPHRPQWLTRSARSRLDSALHDLAEEKNEVKDPSSVFPIKDE